MANTIALEHIENDPANDLTYLYDIDIHRENNEMSQFEMCNLNCNYYEPYEFKAVSERFPSSQSFFFILIVRARLLTGTISVH